jgi:hypothetical protein
LSNNLEILSINNACQLKRKALQQRFAGNFRWMIKNFNRYVGAINVNFLFAPLDKVKTVEGEKPQPG